MVLSVHGRGTHTDSSSVADANRTPDPIGLANPAPVNRAGGVHDWRQEMTAATVNEPVSGYDSLKTKEVIASLSSHSQVELARLRAMSTPTRTQERVRKPPGCARMSRSPATTRSTATRSGRARQGRSRGDQADADRALRARREVLDEVDRLHRERGVPPRLSRREALRKEQAYAHDHRQEQRERRPSLCCGALGKH